MSTGINPVRRSVCIYQGLQCICSTLVSVSSLFLYSLIWGQENHQIRERFGLEGLFKSHLFQLSLVQVAQSSVQPPDLEHLEELVPLSLWTLSLFAGLSQNILWLPGQCLDPLTCPCHPHHNFLWVLVPLEDFFNTFLTAEVPELPVTTPLTRCLNCHSCGCMAQLSFTPLFRNEEKLPKEELIPVKCQMIPSPCFWASVWAERIPSQPGFLHGKPLPHGQACSMLLPVWLQPRSPQRVSLKH